MRILQLVGAVILGMLLVFGAQNLQPILGRALLESDFRSAYLDCALSEAHEAQLRRIHLDPGLRTQVNKTLQVERLRCLDYAELKLRLASFHVSDAQIGLIELDALAKDPILQCEEASCSTARK